MRRILGVLVVAGAAAWSPNVSADDVVHFTNGAEMTVRGHAVEKGTVKLDLGGSSSISFPVAMVDKIVSAGRDVFLNPVYHPSNQAIAPIAATDLPMPLPDRNRGVGEFIGYRRGQSKTGTGLMLGEAANSDDGGSDQDSGRVTTMGKARGGNFSTPKPRGYDVLHPPGPGERATIQGPYADVQARIAPKTISVRPDTQTPEPPPANEQGEGQTTEDGTTTPPQDPPPSN